MPRRGFAASTCRLSPPGSRRCETQRFAFCAALSRVTTVRRQEDIVVRFGDPLDFDGLVLEFLMRQPEVLNALVKGSTLTKQQFWASHPELRDDDEL